MRISNNFATMACIAVLTATASCTRKPFVKMPEEFVSEDKKEQIDTFIKKSHEILEDPDYKYLGKDTIKFDDNFTELARTKAQQYNEKVIVGSHVVYIPISNGKVRHTTPQVIHEYENKFLEPKALIVDSSIFTTDSNDIYVPVEFYGKLNPKAISK